MAVREGLWNHNIHYHPTLLRAVPLGARTALDVGCGEGMFTRALAERVERVVGIDEHRPSIDVARALDVSRRIDYVVGDFLAYEFRPDSFDFIASIATLHHLDAGVALTRMRRLLSPGGSLAILGLARSTPRDLPYEIAGVVVHRAQLVTKRSWEHPSPQVWPPPVTYTAMRRMVVELLPGAQFRRHAMWRYSVVWNKPGGRAPLI